MVCSTGWAVCTTYFEALYTLAAASCICTDITAEFRTRHSQHRLPDELAELRASSVIAWRRYSLAVGLHHSYAKQLNRLSGQAPGDRTWLSRRSRPAAVDSRPPELRRCPVPHGLMVCGMCFETLKLILVTAQSYRSSSAA